MSKMDLNKLRESGQEIRNWQEILAAVAPDRLDWWSRHGTGMREESSLDPKIRELIFVAIDSEARWPHTDAHVAKALDAGATVDEIVEVLVIVSYLKGPHAWVNGIEALGSVLRERGLLPAPA